MEKKVRIEVEAETIGSIATKPRAASYLSKEEKKVFYKIAKLNDYFTESDSMSLSILSKSLYRYSTLNDVLNDLDPLDERTASLERRVHAYDKAVVTHMNLLCIPLSQRLRLANDRAKVLIEERKLEQMSGNDIKKINPVLSILEDFK